MKNTQKSNAIGTCSALVAYLAFMLSASTALANDLSAQAFVPLQSKTLQLADAPGRSPKEKEILEEIRQTSNFLQDRAYPSPTNLPDLYLTSLQNLDELLAETRASSDPAERVSILSDVLADLVAKKKHAQSNAGFASLISDSMLVDVSVSTKLNNVAVNGYSVQCNPRRYRESSFFKIIFNLSTSPSIEKLPPGIFSCTIEKSGAKSLKKDISVGLTGKQKEMVDFVLEDQ